MMCVCVDIVWHFLSLPLPFALCCFFICLPPPWGQDLDGAPLPLLLPPSFPFCAAIHMLYTWFISHLHYSLCLTVSSHRFCTHLHLHFSLPFPHLSDRSHPIPIPFFSLSHLTLLFSYTFIHSLLPAHDDDIINNDLFFFLFSFPSLVYHSFT